jgi:hypothetical protein
MAGEIIDNSEAMAAYIEKRDRAKEARRELARLSRREQRKFLQQLRQEGIYLGEKGHRV